MNETDARRDRFPVGVVATVLVARLVAALAASIVLAGPLARQLRGSSGGEAGLFADGSLRLVDLFLGVGRFALFPPDGTLGAIVVALVAVEIVTVTALFAATHGHGPVLANTGRILPRFVLLAGIKAIVCALVVGVFVLVLPTPQATWLSSRFGWFALALYVAGLLAILGILRIVFDVARSASSRHERSLRDVGQTTLRVVLERPGHLVVRLALVELGRWFFFAAAVGLGALILVRRFGGGGVSGVAFGWISQEALVALAGWLDVVWIRMVRDAVARTRA